MSRNESQELTQSLDSSWSQKPQAITFKWKSSRWQFVYESSGPFACNNIRLLAIYQTLNHLWNYNRPATKWCSGFQGLRLFLRSKTLICVCTGCGATPPPTLLSPLVSECSKCSQRSWDFPDWRDPLEPSMTEHPQAASRKGQSSSGVGFRGSTSGSCSGIIIKVFCFSWHDNLKLPHFTSWCWNRLMRNTGLCTEPVTKTYDMFLRRNCYFYVPTNRDSTTRKDLLENALNIFLWETLFLDNDFQCLSLKVILNWKY